MKSPGLYLSCGMCKHSTMNDQDMLRHLNEYVDGTVEPALCEEFEQHVWQCIPCQVVVDNIA
jgi:hypothetical protein